MFNFHQYLGASSLSSGLPCTLYPIAYISVFLSNLFLGQHFAAIDIFVIIHSLIGCLGVYFLLKAFKLNNLSSLFGAMTWPLCSFVVYVSDSWVYVSGAAAYLPWIIFFGYNLYKKPGIKVFAELMVARLLMFYVGNQQYFIYAMIVELLTVWMIALFKDKQYNKKNLWQLALNYILSYIYTFILALPLLAPMWHQTTISAFRNTSLTFGDFVNESFFPLMWVKGIVWPFVSTPHDNYVWWQYISNLIFIGYIPLFFIAFTRLGLGNKAVKNKKYHKIFFVLIIILIIASNFPTSSVLFIVPILNRFRYPFKFQLFTSFFMIILASFGFNLVYKKVRFKKAMRDVVFSIIIFIQVISLYSLYLFFPQTTFRTHFDKVPFEEPLKNIINDGRIVSLGYQSYNEPYDVNSIGFNYATLWGLYQFGGYDSLISKNNNEACLGINYDGVYRNSENKIPLDYFRLWGVKWYVISNNCKIDVKNVLIPQYSDDKRTVYLDSKAKPLFYWDNNKNTGEIKYDISSNSIKLELNTAQEDNLNINFLFNSFFKATLDGQKAEILKNANKQMSVHIAPGVHKVKIEYIDPYFKIGSYIAILFLGLNLLYLVALKLIKKQPRLNKE